jgi:hypothetical protein
MRTTQAAPGSFRGSEPVTLPGAGAVDKSRAEFDEGPGGVRHRRVPTDPAANRLSSLNRLAASKFARDEGTAHGLGSVDGSVSASGVQNAGKPKTDLPPGGPPRMSVPVVASPMPPPEQVSCL